MVHAVGRLLGYPILSAFRVWVGSWERSHVHAIPGVGGMMSAGEDEVEHGNRQITRERPSV